MEPEKSLTEGRDSLVFANSYWSSDFRTGIEQLCEQTSLLLAQVHHLRKLVFSYMNYSYLNSEFLNNLGKQHYLHEREDHKTAFQRLSDQFTEATRLDFDRNSTKEFEKLMPESDKKHIQPVQLHLQSISEESHNLVNLALVIDRDVLHPITSFIKHNEPIARATIDELNDLLLLYETNYKQVELIKSDYIHYLGLQEMKKEGLHQSPDFESPVEDIVETEEDTDKSSNISSNIQTADAKVNLEHVSEDKYAYIWPLFDFPVALGSLEFKDPTALKEFIDTLGQELPTTKRRIPIPGRKNEMFSSEALCQWISHTRPQRVSPTRVNLEKIGQSMIDHGLIVGTSLLGAKKFYSESMWWEWTDKLQRKTVVVEEESKKTESLAESTDPKFTFNLFFQKNILKNNLPETILGLEEKYNDHYLELQSLRQDLENSIRVRSAQLETFEKQRISLTYQSLTILLQILYNSAAKHTNKLQEMVKEMVETVNLKENYESDFLKLARFSTGVYFPLLASPESLQKKQYLYDEANNNFQNLHYKFNLYQDIPLQVNCDSELLSTSNTPEFLFRMVELIEESSDFKQIHEAWKEPLDFQGNWVFKSAVIDTVSQYKAGKDHVLQVSATNKAIVNTILSTHSKGKSTEQLVNFLKFWLLDIGDSVIPFTVYEPIIHLYKDVDKELSASERQQKLINLLKTIPRSNASSLVYILEHLSKIFELPLIEGYGRSDQISTETGSKEADDSDDAAAEKTLALCKELNSMDIVGAVPFVHLLARPSVVKNSKGFKPPIAVYISLLQDLLSLETRRAVLLNLIDSEKRVRDKRNHELQSLTIKQEEKFTPRSPGKENFTLRPFRTKLTPHTSPVTSPSPTPVQKPASLDSVVGRERSSSLTLLPPMINVEFEK